MLIFSLQQVKGQTPKDVKTALASGNAMQLSKYFCKNIELVIFDNENVYSKTQAEQIIMDFFRKNSPADFLIISEGNIDGFKYTIGNLITSRGRFKIYLVYMPDSGQQSINTLNISDYQ
jgi:hypothetical protein